MSQELLEADHSLLPGGAEYTRENTLHANRTVTYLVGSYLAAEDNCDQAGVKISLCNEDKQDETPATTPNETPSTAPSESTSKDIAPGQNSETGGSAKVDNPDNPAEGIEDVKSTPSAPGVTSGKTTNFGNNTSHNAQGTAATVGPEVNTGGEVESGSFFTKILNIFK